MRMFLPKYGVARIRSEFATFFLKFGSTIPHKGKSERV